MPPEREDLEYYKKNRAHIWYDLAIDEAVSATMYSLAFDTDKIQQCSHLKHARRLLNRFIMAPDVSEANASVGKKEKDEDKYLNEGKRIILSVESGYSSEKDVDAPLEYEEDTHVWRSKNVRGEGMKKRIREANSKAANEMYPDDKKPKKGKNEPQEKETLPIEDANEPKKEENTGRAYVSKLLEQYAEEAEE